MPTPEYPLTIVSSAPYGHDWNKQPAEDPEPMDATCLVCRHRIARLARTYKLHWSRREYAHAKCIDDEQHWRSALLVARRMYDPDSDAWEWPSLAEREHYHRMASWAMNAIASLAGAVSVSHLLGVPDEQPEPVVIDVDRHGFVTVIGR